MSKLHKKKPKNFFKFTPEEQKKTTELKRHQFEEFNMMKRSMRHLQMIGYNVLHDEFGFGKKRLTEFYAGINGVFGLYQEDRVPASSMIKYCLQKKFDVYEWVRGIEQTKKIDFTNYKITGIDTIKIIDSVFICYMMMAVTVLKENFKFSTNDIKKFSDKMLYLIDSYVRKQPKSKLPYLNDTMINSILKDECRIDAMEEYIVA